MLKRIVPNLENPPTTTDDDEGWLDLDGMAQVEVTSEDHSHPVESALVRGANGWIAAAPGEQRIRIIFARPQKIGRILLLFEESAAIRSHEFVLRWAAHADAPFTEIVRQQWNFSPEAPRELEDYRVQLQDVAVLEVVIRPLGNADGVVSLSKLRLA